MEDAGKAVDFVARIGIEHITYKKALEAILAATDITGDGFDDADNALTDIYEIAAKALGKEAD